MPKMFANLTVGKRLIIAFFVVLTVFVTINYISHSNVTTLIETTKSQSHTFEVLEGA